ncbi:MAG: hypothetical protein MUP76_09700, partial [Acidimicrobiia bacterium]|nr:hypothetical protein [Acidimicrobiia bacterium]
MGPIDRIATRLVGSAVPLQRDALLAEAQRIAREEAPLAGPGVAEAAVDSLLGLGPLQGLLADPAITDILVNAPDEIWVERFGVLERSDVAMPDEAAIVAAVERVIAPL